MCCWVHRTQRPGLPGKKHKLPHALRAPVALSVSSSSGVTRFPVPLVPRPAATSTTAACVRRTARRQRSTTPSPIRSKSTPTGSSTLEPPASRRVPVRTHFEQSFDGGDVDDLFRFLEFKELKPGRITTKSLLLLTLEAPGFPVHHT